MFNVNKVEKINIDALYESRRAINERRIKLYNNVLKQVHKRIQFVGKTTSEKDVMYKVPLFLLGESIYIYRDCIEHIVAHLTENGFVVEVEGNCLYISWAHWVPAFIRNELKKKGTYVDALGNFLPPPNVTTDADPSASSTSTSSSTEQETRVAAKYKPISSYRPKRTVVYDEDLLRQTELRLQQSK